MPTGYARASTDDQSLCLQRDPILLGRTPDGAGIGLTGVRKINTGLSGGRLVLPLRT